MGTPFRNPPNGPCRFLLTANRFLDGFAHEDRRLHVAERAVERARDVVAAEDVQCDVRQTPGADLILREEHGLLAVAPTAEMFGNLDRVDEGGRALEVA